MTHPDPEAVTARLAVAVAAAREAGDHTLRYFQCEDLEIVVKADATPVTVADREAEVILRARLGTALPADGIVGEEFGERRGTNGFVWWIDPIDGTQSFVRGVPLYGTLVGLERDGVAVAGVVYLPALAEIYYGVTGGGAWWMTEVPRFADDPIAPRRLRPARVSAVTTIGDARLNTTSGKGFAAPGLAGAYARLVAETATDRTWGDCYGHMLVATGRAEIMIDPVMQDWDCAALAPIVIEAGGRFTDLAGRPTIHGKSAVSTNGALHDHVLAALR